MKKYRITLEEPTREFILIICEGKKTEPNYFRGYLPHLPKLQLQIDIYGGAGNTRSLVTFAEKKNRERMNKYEVGYDHIWLVFDKDDFSPNRFNTAIFQATAHKMKCAYSNEAFELWYLLHFEYCNTAITRQQYIEKLITYLGEYKKNDEKMYEKLLGYDPPKAIARAKKLFNLYDHNNPAREVPCTTVYMLVEELNKYINQISAYALK